MVCMAKVTISGVNSVKESVVKLFNEIKQDQRLLLEIGEKTVELTRAFNRAGKSPDKKGNRHPRNSEAWEQRKKQLTKTNNPSEFYKFGLSNVTFTGQLLESIRLIKILKNQGSVIIDADGPRQPYKNLNGTSVSKKNTPSNNELVVYLKKKGRIIFGINKQMENVINKIVRTYINKAIKKSFGK